MAQAQGQTWIWATQELGMGPAPGQRSKKVAGKKQGQGERRGGANLQQAAPESHLWPCKRALHGP